MRESIKSSVNNGHTNPFTPEEDAFIVANINLMSFEELAAELNERYHRNRTWRSVYLRNYNYLHAKKNGVRPVGSEHFNGTHWYIKVRGEFTRTHSKSYLDCWELKHKHIWEQANGKVPEGHVLLFLDGDVNNCELENLYCVPAKINAMMCRYKWHFDSVEAKKTAIKWCELYYALKEDKQ